MFIQTPASALLRKLARRHHRAADVVEAPQPALRLRVMAMRLDGAAWQIEKARREQVKVHLLSARTYAEVTERARSVVQDGGEVIGLPYFDRGRWWMHFRRDGRPVLAV